MARPIKRLLADGESLAQLRRRARSSTVAVRDRARAEMVLLRIEGFSVAAVAERLGTTPKRVSTWSKRFERSGLDGLEDKPGRGRKPSIPAGKVERVLTEATRPPKGRSRWSVRSMGRHAGVSPSTVQRIWSKNELKPYQNVQTVERSKIRGEVLGRDRPLPRSAGESAGTVLRREEPVPGARAHAAWAAACAAAAAHHDARLHTSRHSDAVCSP